MAISIIDSTSQGGVPCFSAYANAAQTVAAATSVLGVFDIKNFDTATKFNNTGSTVGGIPAYAFLPNIAGYYQVNATWGLTVGGATGAYEVNVFIYKNGSRTATGSTGASSAAAYPISTGSTLLYLNGSTDYIQLYLYNPNASSQPGTNGVDLSNFSACFVRSA